VKWRWVETRRVGQRSQALEFGVDEGASGVCACASGETTALLWEVLGAAPCRRATATCWSRGRGRDCSASHCGFSSAAPARRLPRLLEPEPANPLVCDCG
jgi:hypothetical protein